MLNTFAIPSVRPTRALNHIELLRRCQREQLIESFEDRGDRVLVRNAGISHDLSTDQARLFARAILDHAPTFARLRQQAADRSRRPDNGA